MFPQFFLINKNYIELYPNGRFIVKTSISDKDEAIEITENFVLQYLVTSQRFSYFSRKLMRGFHRLVNVYRPMSV